MIEELVVVEEEDNNTNNTIDNNITTITDVITTNTNNTNTTTTTTTNKLILLSDSNDINYTVDIQFSTERKNYEFHKLFNSIPIDELLVQEFSCALKKEILLQVNSIN